MAKNNQEHPNSITVASKDFRTSNCDKESKSKSTLNVDVVGDDESPNIDLLRLGVMEFLRINLLALNVFIIHDQLPSL